MASVAADILAAVKAAVEAEFGPDDPAKAVAVYRRKRPETQAGDCGPGKKVFVLSIADGEPGEYAAFDVVTVTYPLAVVYAKQALGGLAGEWDEDEDTRLTRQRVRRLFHGPGLSGVPAVVRVEYAGREPYQREGKSLVLGSVQRFAVVTSETTG